MTTRVEALMSAPVVSVTPQHSSQACMSLMSEMRLRHLPVLDDGRLVGLLSIGDLMQEVIREQDGLIHSLEQYIRGAA
jgi:CBS domain-containing protein